MPASVPLVEGPRAGLPRRGRRRQGGAWVAYVVHRHRGPEVLESLTERPESFSRLRPRGGRRPGQLAPVRRRQGRRRPSTSPAPGATSGGPPSPWTATAGSSSPGPRTATATGTSTARRYDPGRRVLVRAEAADDRPRDRHRRRPGHRPRRQGLDGLAALERRPGRHPRWPRSTDPSPPVNVSDDAGQRVVARDRDRPGRPRPRRLRQLPGGQLRRHRSAPAAADGDARPAGRRGRLVPVRGAAEPGGRPAGAGLGRLRGADRELGQGLPRTWSTARARPSTARAPCGSAASTATGCSTPPTRVADAPEPIARR